MSAINSQAEYNSKREEVLAKFRKEFAEKYYVYDPAFRAIAELLIRDVDPYEIIENLILDRERLVKEYSQLAMQHPPIFNPNRYECQHEFITKSINGNDDNAAAICRKCGFEP